MTNQDQPKGQAELTYAALKSATTLPIADTWIDSDFESNHVEERPKEGVYRIRNENEPHLYVTNSAAPKSEENALNNINFICWITGHDEETVRQMYADYGQNKTKANREEMETGWISVEEHEKQMIRIVEYCEAWHEDLFEKESELIVKEFKAAEPKA